jgi:hypothetical protein
MGLGKSLVILSRIAGSYNEAAEFALSENGNDPDQIQGNLRSKATLVLAPSSRKYPYGGTDFISLSSKPNLSPNR